MKIKNIYIAAVIAAVLASCGTQKAVVKPTTTPKPTPTNATAGQEKKQAEQEKKQQLQYVQRVSDLALYQKNVVSDLSFTVNTGKKEITVPGILHMRKDEVIRLQLLIPLLRSESSRINVVHLIYSSNKGRLTSTRPSYYGNELAVLNSQVDIF